MDIQQFAEYKQKILGNVTQVIVGKDEAICLLITAYLCRGHVLLEDLPGTGKTMLMRAFAATIGGSFKRIQFTPDLLPSDLTGINFYNRKTGEFEFRPGPLFTNVVLADEINRATPRTQAALLEVMEERQITVDGVTMSPGDPFLVMATQNPIESYGTFPLPDAQLDRFFMRLSLGYMEREQEISVICGESAVQIVQRLEQAVTAEETQAVQQLAQTVVVSGPVMQYLMDIIERTRSASSFISGVSTRGAIALYQASRVWALMEGRTFVIPEDVRFLAPYILGHRVRTSSGTGSREGMTFIEKVLSEVEVPLESLS